MLKEERLRAILERLNQDQKVLLTTLSKELKVSEYTIRRDIKTLAEKGLLKAVRGGAVPHSPNSYLFKERIHQGSEIKKTIAEKALGLLQENQVIILDGGTTTLTIASMLPDNMHLTVLTNSFPIVSILEGHENVEVLFAGGRLSKKPFVTTGHDTIDFFSKFHADLCFLGICSIHPTLGVTSPDYEEGEVKRSMIHNSLQVVALSSLEKIHTAEPYLICPVQALDTIITDFSPDHPSLSALIEAGINVL
ncbi:DeoR/GlpR family DNA-binding transcription regulator [Rapidithrix thailandica]|uniref:DeoR/GlpR family DNA-binding transcription regulator n=1 Tax=Rapidithrix thailandica TaxID=413964 RepID=A0AAW9S258_9BACT